MKKALPIAAALALLAGPLAAAPLAAANDPETSPGTVSARGTAVSEAWLVLPTERYRHFVRGNDSESGGLRVRLAGGDVLTLVLPDDMVFEDDRPRLADLDGDGREEVVVVMSSLREGACLAIFAVRDGSLEMLARTAFTGMPKRWLNPAGIADLDGDGRSEIALVQMPHLMKRLEIWRLEGRRLVRLAASEDVSNHRLGSPHTQMAAIADFDGDGVADLAVPSGDRRSIRFLSFAGGTLGEIGRAALPAPADGALSLTQGRAGPGLRVRLETGDVVSASP